MSGWKMSSRLAVLLCMCVLLFCAARARGSEASYVSFQVPGSMGTYPMSVNNSMAVTGYYYASSTVVRGFVREPDGAVTTFDVAGSGWTEPESINDAGEITGYYEDFSPKNSFQSQSFIRYADGHIITFNPPCAYDCGALNPFSTDAPSQTYSINAFGEVVGSFPYASTLPAGFSRLRNGSFTAHIQEFNVSEFIRPYGVVATAINGSGTFTGFYGWTGPAVVQSFIEDARGYLIDGITVPSPGTNQPYTGLEVTVAQGINAEGAVVGWYAGCNRPCPYGPFTAGGFVRSPQGEITPFTPPGTLVTSPSPGLLYQIDNPSFPGSSSFTAGPLSYAPHRLNINQEGSVTGSYTDTAGAQHGFVRNPYGTTTSFDPPKGHQTTATGINDNGVITGTYLYVGTNPTSEGFLRIPESQP